jgi:hypothetical protein
MPTRTVDAGKSGRNGRRGGTAEGFPLPEDAPAMLEAPRKAYAD